MFGLTMEKVFVILLIAAFVIGPRRLPAAAAMLADWTKRARRALDGLKERAGEELGPEVEEIDWRKLDPRQYDPRAIIRSALLDPEPPRAVPAHTESPANGGETEKRGTP